MVASQTTDGYIAVLTGLTNGVPYTFSVTATNPIGTGPAATSAAVTPAAVPGGSSQYVTGASQYLNAQDALNSGTVTTASAALAGDSMAAADITGLSNQNLALSPLAVTLAANQESLASDSTSLSNTLAMLSPDGQTVTVFAQASESFTINDTSSGSLLTYPGGSTTDELLTYANPGSSPQLTGTVDADAALGQIGPGDNQNAWSPVLDAAFIAAVGENAPAPLATDAFGNFTAGSDSGSPCPGPCQSALTAIASWGKSNALCGGTNPNNHSLCWDHYDRDACTDFASRALQLGGGVGFFEEQHLTTTSRHDLDQWYYNKAHIWATGTWADALYLADLEKRYGGHFYSYASKTPEDTDINAGSFVFATFNPDKEFFTIDHTGVVIKVLGKNLIIAQHNKNAIEPLWAAAGQASWFNHKVVAAWAVQPYLGQFVDHTAIDCDDYTNNSTCVPT